MKHEEPDDALLRVYRNFADENPLPGIDERLLRAAEAQALKQRRRHYLAPLAVAAALILTVAFIAPMREMPTPQAQRIAAVDRIADQLLHLQPPPADRSTVADFLLDSNSLAAVNAEINGDR